MADFETRSCTKLPINQEQFQWFTELLHAAKAGLFDTDHENQWREDAEIRQEAYSMHQINYGYLTYDWKSEEDFTPITLDIDPGDGDGLIESGNDHYYIESKDCGSEDQISFLLYILVLTYKLEPITINYCNVAGTSAPDSYGGGSIVITQDGITEFDGYTLARNFVKDYATKSKDKP